MLFFFSMIHIRRLYVMDDCFDVLEEGYDCATPLMINNYDFTQCGNALEIYIFTDILAPNVFNFSTLMEDSTIYLSGFRKNLNEDPRNHMRVFTVDLSNTNNISKIVPSFIIMKFVQRDQVKFEIDDSNGTLFVPADDCNKIIPTKANITPELQKCFFKSDDYNTTQYNNALVRNNCSKYEYSYYLRCIEVKYLNSFSFEEFQDDFNIFISDDIDETSSLQLNFSSPYNVNISISSFDGIYPITTEQIDNSVKKRIANIDLDSFTDNNNINSFQFFYLDLRFIGDKNTIPVNFISMHGVHLEADQCNKNILSSSAKNFMIEHSSANTLRCFGIPELITHAYNAILISNNCDDSDYDFISTKCVEPNNYNNDLFADFSETSDTVRILVETSMEKIISFEQIPYNNFSTLLIEHKEVSGFNKILPKVSIDYDSMENLSINLSFEIKYVDLTFITKSEGFIDWVFTGSINLSYSKINISNGYGFILTNGINLVCNYRSNYEIFNITEYKPNEYKYLVISDTECQDIEDDFDYYCCSNLELNNINFSSFNSPNLSIFVTYSNQHSVLNLFSDSILNYYIEGQINEQGSKPDIFINTDLLENDNIDIKLKTRDINLHWLTDMPMNIVPFSFLYFYDTKISGSQGFIKLNNETKLLTNIDQNKQFFEKDPSYRAIVVSKTCCETDMPDNNGCIGPDMVKYFNMSFVNRKIPVFTISLEIDLKPDQLFNFNVDEYQLDQVIYIRKSEKLVSQEYVDFTFLIPSMPFKKVYFKSLNLSFDTSKSHKFVCRQMSFEDVIIDKASCSTFLLDGAFESNIEYPNCWPSTYQVLIISNDCLNEIVQMRCVLPKDAAKLNAGELTTMSGEMNIILKADLEYDQQIDFSRLRTIPNNLIIKSETGIKKFTFQIPKIFFPGVAFNNINLSFSTIRTSSFGFDECYLNNVVFDTKYCTLVYAPGRIATSSTDLPSKCFSTDIVDPKYSSFVVNDLCVGNYGDSKCILPYDANDFDTEAIDYQTNLITITLETNLDDDYLLDLSEFQENISVTITSTKNNRYLFKIPGIRLNVITISNLELTFFDNVFNILKCKELIFDHVTMNQEYCNKVAMNYETFTSDSPQYPTNCFKNEYTFPNIKKILISNGCNEQLEEGEICLLPNDISNFNLEKMNPKEDVFVIDLRADMLDYSVFNFNLFPEHKTLVVTSVPISETFYYDFFFKIPTTKFLNITFQSFNLFFDTTTTNLINAVSMTFISMKMRQNYCDGIKLIGESFVSIGGNVGNICFGMNDQDRPTPIYGLNNVVYIKNECGDIDVFPTSYCINYLSPLEIDFYRLDDSQEVKIIVEMSIFAANPITFHNISDEISVKILSESSKHKVFLTVPKIHFKTLTITNCDIVFNYSINELLYANRIVLDNSIIDNDACGNLLILQDTIVEGDNGCLVRINDKYPDTSAAVLVNSGPCVSLPNVICIHPDKVFEYDFSYIDYFKDTLIIEIQVATTDSFDFRTLKFPINIHVNCLSLNYVFSLSIFKIGTNIRDLAFKNTVLNFLIHPKNKLECERFTIDDSVKLEDKNSRTIDITGISYLDFGADKFYKDNYFVFGDNGYKSANVFASFSFDSITQKGNDLSFSGIAVSMFNASNINVFVENDINFAVDSVGERKVIIRPINNIKATIDRESANKAGFKFGAELIGKSLTLEYPYSNIPVSVTGEGNMIFDLSSFESSFKITESVTVKNIVLSCPNRRTVTIENLYFKGVKPKLETTLNLEVNNVILNDFQLPKIAKIKILKLLSIGLLANLTGQIEFGASADVEIAYYQGQLLSLVFEGNTNTPRSVKLVRKTTLMDTKTWPETIKLFPATDSQFTSIDFSDSEGKYEKKLVNGTFCASIKNEKADQKDDSKPFSTGGIIGIVIGVPVVIVLIVLIVVFSRKKKEIELTKSNEEEEEALELPALEGLGYFSQQKEVKPDANPSYEIESTRKEYDSDDDFYL